MVEIHIIHSNKGTNFFQHNFVCFFLVTCSNLGVSHNKHTCSLQEKKKKKKNLAQEYEERKETSVSCFLSLSLVCLVFFCLF